MNIYYQLKKDKKEVEVEVYDVKDPYEFFDSLWACNNVVEIANLLMFYDLDTISFNSLINIENEAECMLTWYTRIRNNAGRTDTHDTLVIYL